MSDLQIGLILLGIVLIMGVLVFNWWQDRRIRRQIAEQFPEHRHDPLMGGSAQDHRLEPGLAEAGNASEAGDAVDTVDDDIPDIDATIEVVIDIAFGTAMPGDKLQQALAGLSTVALRALRVVAMTESGAHHNRARPSCRYQSLQLVALLANRSGPLTAIDWSRLWAFAQSLADEADGTLEGPDLETVETRAQELDALCAGLDGQVGIVLQLGQPVAVQAVSQTMQEAGFIEKQGQWHWLDQQGRSCFIVLIDAGAPGQTGQSSLARLDFVLDLPHTSASQHAFSRMADVARHLAAQLDAELLDDSGKPLPDHTDSLIDAQLHQMYQALESAGFAAGHARTIRVFS